jgi:uncharacterized DUF497 family protein
LLALYAQNECCTLVGSVVDPRKAASNARKHGIGFADVARGRVWRGKVGHDGKTRVTIRIEKAAGGNYQSLINLALRDFVGRRREPLENTLRRVIRAE